MTATRAPAAPLENNANNLSPPPLGPGEKRAERWGKRAVLWSASSIKRVRHCGRVPRSTATGVTLRRSGLGAGFAGLQHCGSVHACPVCSAKILTHRGLDIGVMLGEAIRQGYSLGFFTYTMRHRKNQPLGMLWDAAGEGWHRATTGKAWVSAQKRCGVVGWVRVWEVTEGANGWHVHVHGVLVLAPGASAVQLDDVAGGMFNRWGRGLTAAGLEAPMLRGQDWHVVQGEGAAVEVADYLFKLVDAAGLSKGLGFELTQSQPGRARDALRTRPVWGLLDDLAETGEVGKWREWETASKNRRQVAYSKGFRERFAPELEELGDEEIADAEAGSAEDDVIHWTLDQWRELVSHPERLPQLLEAAEAVGPVGLVALRGLLNEWGVPYQVVERARPDGG